jgi:phage I-like protein
MRLVKRTSVQLTPFRISNGAMATGTLPRRLKLLDWGINKTVKGDIIVNELTAARLPALQAARGFDRVALDYEHNTVEGSAEFARTKEPREVAAYGVPVLIKGEGLFLDQVAYTPSGETHARNYADLSPTPELAADGTVLFLHSVALVRQGAVEGLSFFSVEMAAVDQESEQVTKNQEEIALMEKILALLKKALGLAEAATEDEVVTAIQALSALQPKIVALETALGPLVALTAADGKLTMLSAGLEGIKGKLGDTDVTGKITTLSAELETIRKDLVCYQARIEGKVVPLSADELKTTSLETLTGMIAKLPVTVPVGKLTPLSVKEHAAGAGDVHTAADIAVAKACGVILPAGK